MGNISSKSVCILLLLFFAGCLRVDNRGFVHLEGSCKDSVEWYDGYISDLHAKLDYLNCDEPSLVPDEYAKYFRCTELTHELNSLVNERNALACVTEN